MERTDSFKLKNKYLLLIAMIIPFFTGYGGIIPNVVTVVELLIAVYFINSDDFYLLTPIMCIYYSQFVLIGDRLGGYNIFMWLCMFRMFKDRGLYIKELRPMCGLIYLFMFSALVLLMWSDIWAGVNFFFLSLGTVQVALKNRKNPELKRYFKMVLVIMCLSATVYGIGFENIKGFYEETEDILQNTGRYCGTMSDPNYMAFYYCLSFVYVIFSKQLSFLLKSILFILLFISTAITGSLTALLTIFAVLLLYFWFGERGNSRKKFISCITVIVVAIALYYLLFTDLFDIKVLTVFRLRIEEKMGFLFKDDFSAATSGRTEYSQAYVNYLFNQNIIRILFGGYQLNAMGLTGNAFNEIGFAAHNSYVDVLMTCGIVGFVVFIYHFIFNIIVKFKKWKYQRDNQDLSDVMTLVISMVFLFGLSCFPALPYMLFIMI